MAWVNLLIAGAFETAWVIGLKYSDGLSRLLPSVLTIIGMVLSFYFLSQATKVLPIGTSYAVWTGIGVIGATVLGIALFNEPANAPRFIFLALILVGIIGLNLTAAE